MFYKAPNQYITEGNAFEINGTQYPANWLNLSTPEEKAALGLEEVTDANAPLDDRFYWVSSTLNGAVRTTAANTVTAINAATDVPSLQAAIVVDWPHDPNYVAA